MKIDKLQIHIQNPQAVKNILRKSTLEETIKDGTKVTTELYYLSNDDGTLDLDDFFSIIKSSIISNFVFTSTRISRETGLTEEEVTESLVERSIDFISQHTAQGELGELLLFTILEVYFDAPKILSKISLKTNRKMAVHGVDAVHAQFVKDSLILYLGESKLRDNFSSSCNSAVDSISNTFEEYNHEFSLIESNINYPNMDEEGVKLLLDFFNPFKKASNNYLDSIHTPCFIGFTGKKLFSSTDEIQLDLYKVAASEYLQKFYTKLLEKGIDASKTVLLLLPFYSVDDLVKQFIKYLDIKA